MREDYRLYSYRAREYHPILGRFLQRDPLGESASLNLYAYVLNSPANLVDPTGMESAESQRFWSEVNNMNGDVRKEWHLDGTYVGWATNAANSAEMQFIADKKNRGSAKPNNGASAKTRAAASGITALASGDPGGGEHSQDLGPLADGFTEYVSVSASMEDSEWSGSAEHRFISGDRDWFRLGFNSTFRFLAANSRSKHYGKATRCRSSASHVMGAVESNFKQFGDYSRWLGLESVTFSPPPGMGPGSIIPIAVNVFGFTEDLSVSVESMDPQSMTFTTNPGHLLYPASITFAASPASPGSINFSIDIEGTVASPLEFRFGGEAFEDAQWKHFLGQVSGFCEAGDQ